MNIKHKRYNFLDPIHGNIQLNTENKEEKLILDLIETREFQRLRRIRQLGFSYLTFYGAESTRFVHSIGCFEITRKIVEHLENKLNKKQKSLIEEYRLPLWISALLHDIGHGPFSHSSEPAFNFEHERWTIKNLIENTEINNILNNYDRTLIQKVCDILQGKSKEISFISQIISGQLDSDRADYLLRDSHQTGTSYGIFQLSRIINSLELQEYKNSIKLIVNEKGIQAVEDYLFARYSMYLQVYHHKKTLSADALFISLIKRAKYLLHTNNNLFIDNNLKPWILDSSTKTINHFLEFDDICILYHMKHWANNSQDEILQDLSFRLLNRKLFRANKRLEITDKKIKEIKDKLGLERAEYYCVNKECKEFPYNDKKKPILVKVNNKIKELSHHSNIAIALMNKGKELDIEWIFYPAL